MRQPVVFDARNLLDREIVQRHRFEYLGILDDQSSQKAPTPAF
jgi:hypothetical protein